MKFPLRLFYLLIVLHCFSCKKGTIEIRPQKDDKPRIISLRIPGLANDAVTIDQQSFEITIKLSASLDKNIEPQVELSEGAEIRDILWQSIFSGDCDECHMIELVRSDDPIRQPASKYKIRLVPEGKLELLNSDTPVEYVLYNLVSDKILIPARNLYGNELPKRIQLTHIETNESIELRDTLVGGRYKYLARGWGDSFNFLWLQMHEITQIRPGRYRLELINGDGSKIKFAEPILMKVGPIDMENWDPGQGREVKPGGLLTVFGRNLFGNGLSINLIDSLDNMIKLTGAEFDKYGNRFSVSIPPSVKYGHYVLSVRQDDGFNKLQLCSRLHIKSRAMLPFEIVALGEGLGSCSIKGPVRIPKNQWVDILANGIDAKIRLRLESLGQSNEQYSAEAFLYSYSSPKGEPSARIPNNVPTGSYHVFLQVLNAENKVILETPRFWRVIEVY